MNPLKIGFFGAVAVVIATSIVLITNLPTIADILVEAGSAVLFVIAGRKSTDWF